MTWGQIHLYFTVIKYFSKVFVFDVYELQILVVNYFSKVFYIFKYFQVLFQTNLSINISFSQSAKLITFTALQLCRTEVITDEDT